jgi:hypothetical protein
VNRDQANEIVGTAIDQLIAEQPELLDLDVSERALCHQLAKYIAVLVPNDLHLQTDCEYNRHGANPKRLDLPPRDALDRELRATTVFPDIIVHRRGTDDHNEIVLEIKKPGGDVDYDTLKLRKFRKVLSYRNPAHVILGRTANGETVRDVIWQDN